MGGGGGGWRRVGLRKLIQELVAKPTFDLKQSRLVCVVKHYTVLFGIKPTYRTV